MSPSPHGDERRRFAAFAIGLAAAIATTAVVALPAQAALIPKQIVPEACTGAKLTLSKEQGGCTLCHLGVMAINLTNFLMFAIAIPAAALLVTLAGIVILTSGGSDARLGWGKDILAKAVIGAIIVFIAWLAVDTLFKIFTAGKDGRPGFRGAVEVLGPWNEFPAERCGI